MNPLNLKTALELIDILSPYLPDFMPDQESTDYMQEMFDGMIEREDYDSYFKALSLMTRKTEVEISEMPVVEIFGLFLKGLATNKILDLQDFSRSLGLHG